MDIKGSEVEGSMTLHASKPNTRVIILLETLLGFFLRPSHFCCMMHSIDEIAL